MGAQVILDVAGRDCTEPFLAAHPESVMKLTLGPKGLAESHRGEVDKTSTPVHEKAGATAGHGASYTSPPDPGAWVRQHLVESSPFLSLAFLFVASLHLPVLT